MPLIAEFVTSVADLAQLPQDGLPEIAWAGRSNVGKSSLINTLVMQRGLARTSNTPGRTQTLNYYRITPPGAKKAFYLVDMPGYGFAAVNAVRRAQWGELMEGYLHARRTLRGIVQLVDLRHPPQPLDLVMAEWLHAHDHPYLVVGAKADKVAKTTVPERMIQIAEALHIDSRDTLACSASTALGRDQLWRWVLAAAGGVG